MALFSSVFRQLSERFTPLRETLQKRAAQELTAVEKLSEEQKDFGFLANDRKCRNTLEKCQLGEREEKNEGKINKRGSHKEVDRETLSLEDIKIKMNGRVHQKKREMHSLEKLMEGGSELKKAGEKKRKEALPLLVEVKPRPTPDRSSVLKPIEEGELSVSEPLAAYPSLPCIPLYVDPPKPLAVPPRPTPAPDDLFSLRRSSSQVRLPKRLPLCSTPASDEAVALRCPASRKPRPSPFKAPPMLVEIEDEESEYVEFTRKTFRVSGLCKSERLRTPEAERKPTKMVAWSEKEREVQEEVWTSKVEKLQGFEDDPKNETQHKVNIQEEVKRKGPFFPFTGSEKKAEKQREKRIIEANRRQRKRELKLERLMSDPKLRHVWMNRHNLNCNC